MNKDIRSGTLLLIATAVALLWANSPWQKSYFAITEPLHELVTSGILAIFFFVVGMELKQEFRLGVLNNPKAAAVPIGAAFGGVAAPALCYFFINQFNGNSSSLNGWAVPTATDIAFALAILAVFGKGLPKAVRIFLLTLAVVDDLIAIIIIGVFYSSNIKIGYLVIALALLALFRYLIKSARITYLLTPIAIGIWWMVWNSGIHATIAGVLIGLCVPAIANAKSSAKSQPPSLTVDKLINIFQPLSNFFALPLFAFFAAGISLSGISNPAQFLSNPIFLGVTLGLILGKFIGVLGIVLLLVKAFKLQIPGDITFTQLVPLGFLAGIGFTVSLLVAELAFSDSEPLTTAKVGIIAASLTAALLGIIALRVQAIKK